MAYTSSLSVASLYRGGRIDLGQERPTRQSPPVEYRKNTERHGDQPTPVEGI